MFDYILPMEIWSPKNASDSFQFVLLVNGQWMMVSLHSILKSWSNTGAIEVYNIGYGDANSFQLNEAL